MHDPERDKASKRELTKARNRSIIVNAAREVFVDIGYDAASVRDIVARTDLAPGTFYNYFPDKQSVLLAIVGEASDVGRGLVREARLRPGTLAERVHAGFRAYFAFIAGDRALFALMRRNFATLRSLGVDETGFAAGLTELQEELRAAIDAGLLPPLPLPYITRAIGSLALELGVEMAAHDPPDVEGATAFATDWCLGALDRLKRKAYVRKPESADRPAGRAAATQHGTKRKKRVGPRKQRTA